MFRTEENRSNATTSGVESVHSYFGFRGRGTRPTPIRQRAAKEIREFQGRIPGLIDVAVDENLSPRGQDSTFAGLMRPMDRAACDAYARDPAHIALLDWLVPLIEPVELDFEA
ncbi:MAG TPA: Dabb family protein [Terracidiphilus sp.]